jgi:hypothetical protein
MECSIRLISSTHAVGHLATGIWLFIGKIPTISRWKLRGPFAKGTNNLTAVKALSIPST